MITDPASLVEGIRGLLLRPQPPRELVESLATSHAQAVGQVNALLARCHGWAQRGLTSEACSLGEAVRLAPVAASLRLDGVFDTWARLLSAASLPSPSVVDAALLESYVAMAGREQALAPLLASMRVAALRRASVVDRLATLRALVDRDPRQPAWLECIRRLEREAVAALAEAAREAIQTEDAQIASEVLSLVDAMALRVDSQRDLFDKVRLMAEADRLRSAQRQARELLETLHAAAASMDMPALTQAAQAWERLLSEHALGEALVREAAGPLDLLRRDRQRAAEQRERDAAVSQLELALDQGASMAELERLADAATRADAALTPAVARRLQERRQRASAERSRRNAAVGLAGVLVAALLAVAGWQAFRWWSDENRLAAAVAEIDRATLAADWPTADRVVEAELADASHAGRSELEAARQRLANAKAAQAAAMQASSALLAEAESLLRNGQDPLVLETRARELAALVDQQPPPRQAEFRALALRLQAVATERRDRGLDQARAAQRALEAQLVALGDPLADRDQRSDPASLRAASERFAELAREAREGSVEAASHRDAQALSEAMLATATAAEQRAQACRQRAERIDQIANIFQVLERPGGDEEAALQQWSTLVSSGGDLLSERGLLRACEAGLAAAKAGVAIRAWRVSVIPALIAGRGDPNQPLVALDWGDPITARALDVAMTQHLVEHANTPYHAAATSLQDLARRTLQATGTAQSLGEAAAVALKATGYAGLFEQGFEGGRTFYLRRLEGNAAGAARAVDSRKDLLADPSALAPRKLPPFKRVTAERLWPSSKLVEAALAGLKGATGRQARDQWLRMLADMRTVEVGDPVLQWHATRDLWNLWMRLFADEADPEDAAAAAWVRSLDAVGSLAGEDPVVLASMEAGARVDALRRQARQQLAGTFDANRLLTAAARRDERLAEQSCAAAPLGVARPAADAPCEAVGVRDGQRGVVPTPGARGWRLAPLRVEKGRVVWLDAPPDPPLAWPQIIFMQGDPKR